MNRLNKNLRHPFVVHLLFWLGVLAYFVLSVSMHFYSGYWQVIEVNLMVVSLQASIAYLTIYVLIPQFLNEGKILAFIICMLLALLVLFAFYNLYMMYYYDPKYYEFYTDSAKGFAQENFWQRFSKFPVFLSKVIKFLTPTALLLMARFYRNQQKLLKINEQKKTAELAALKNQLNPHFLFNTLNNLYSLAIEKSEKTPEVIERLSDILDYMLHRCNEQFVSLNKEIELIENYLALEKIRYGKRVNLQFHNQIEEELRIAPLLLLTFIENAFKHGVSPALKASVAITLKEQDDYIEFTVQNTKPKTVDPNRNSVSKQLGLQNVRQQLALLYPNKHTLKIEEREDHFSVCLALKKK